MRQTSFLHSSPFQNEDGIDCLRFEFGGQGLKLVGSGCGGLSDGWRAEFLYSGFAPILIVQLAHLNGEMAVWYVASDGTRIAGELDDLDDCSRNLLRRVAAPVLGNLVRGLMEHAEPRLEQAAKDFLWLDHGTKVKLMHLACSGILSTPELQLVCDKATVIPIMVGPNAHPTLLSHRYIFAALSLELQVALARSISAGNFSFEIPSPVSGRLIKAQASMCFDDYHFAYRFIDDEAGIVFYMIAGYELSQVYAMYFPQLNIAFCLPGKLNLGELFVKHLPHWLPEHIARYGSEFAQYLSRPVGCMTSLLRAPPWTHIGHQLWNELTGIDKLPGNAGYPDALEWAVPDTYGPIEFYGPIDVLFPHLLGRVKRGFDNADDMIRYAYANHRFVVRITDDFVSENLRLRILSHAASVGPASHDLQRMTASDVGPRILLGLRVGNRTLTDLQGFYVHLIAAVLSLYPKAYFVIDGHNISKAGHHKYLSHGEQMSDIAVTMHVEREILQTLMQAYGADVIVSAIGLMVPANLLLINQCEFFVAMWGAGLAKYRWVCNKPGYVLTSQWNLAQRADLSIYDHPGFMENPNKLYWVDPVFVTDIPEAPRLVGKSNHAQWANFSITEAPVIEAIVQAIGMHVDHERACSMAQSGDRRMVPQ